MPEQQIETRPFTMPDAEALQRSDVMRLGFLERQAEFIAFDPQFGGSFATVWKSATDAGYNQNSDELQVDILTVYTDALNTTMRTGSAAIADLRYFVTRAFGTSGHYRAFRFKEHNRMRHMSVWYALYLDMLHGVAQMHSVALTAKGMTPAHLAALSTAATAIRQADLEQELEKCKRISATVTRIELFKAMWWFPQNVHSAAEVIYASNPAMKGVFVLG